MLDFSVLIFHYNKYTLTNILGIIWGIYDYFIKTDSSKCNYLTKGYEHFETLDLNCQIAFRKSYTV